MSFGQSKKWPLKRHLAHLTPALAALPLGSLAAGGVLTVFPGLHESSSRIYLNIYGVVIIKVLKRRMSIKNEGMQNCLVDQY